jgi:hypothetical protein
MQVPVSRYPARGAWRALPARLFPTAPITSPTVSRREDNRSWHFPPPVKYQSFSSPGFSHREIVGSSRQKTHDGRLTLPNFAKLRI